MTAPPNPTVTELLAPLVDVTDRGVHDEDSFVSWRDHIQAAAELAAALTARLDPDRPPHVGVLLGNTPFFSTVLVAAGLAGLVPVGLNPTRRGDAFARDVAHADCQLVLTDDPTGGSRRRRIHRRRITGVGNRTRRVPRRTGDVRRSESRRSLHADLHLGHQR